MLPNRFPPSDGVQSHFGSFRSSPVECSSNTARTRIRHLLYHLHSFDWRFDTPPDPDFAVRLRNRVKSLKIDQPDQLTKDGGHRWKFTWGVAENSLLSSYDASKWITMVWNQSGESFWIILHLVSCLYVEFKVSFGRELTSFLSYVLICLHSGVLLAVIFWQLRWVPTLPPAKIMFPWKHNL